MRSWMYSSLNISLVTAIIICHIVLWLDFCQSARTNPKYMDSDFTVQTANGPIILSTSKPTSQDKKPSIRLEFKNVEDNTIYVRDITDMHKLEMFPKGVIFWNYHGGFANQAYFFVSSLILADIRKVPFFCKFLTPFYRIIME